MPAGRSFGLNGNVLEYLVITDDNDASGLIWKYDQENKKLRAYVQGYDHGAAGAVVMDDYPIVAGAGVTSGISVSLTSAAAAGIARLGGLQELLGGTAARAAQVL